MTTGPAVGGPLRRWVRRLRPAESARRRAYARWRAGVEPELLARPRVLRFAAPALTAELAVRPVEMPVLRDVAELGSVRSEWALVVDPGARPAEGALEAVGRAAALAPDADLITGDEDVVDGAGRRNDPAIRPGPSPDLLAARDLAGSAIAVRVSAARAVGLPEGPDARWALARALTGTDGARAAHVAAILAHRMPGPAGAVAPVSPRSRPSVRGEPAVEVVVPFRDRPELLERAIGSLLSLTDWERLRVTLVDNGSTVPPPPALIADRRVGLLSDPRTFNFAALCNAAAARSRADVLVFLNNDTEVVEPGWLERLVAEAQRPDVGAVAPLLVHPDGRVQHAGVAVGLFGVAGHLFAGLDPDQRTPFGAATDGPRNCLAVTAACLAVERAKLDAVGGFDESFVVAGQDVELGLRLTARGWRSLCLTDVRVVHDEGVSRGEHVDPTDLARSAEAYEPFLSAGDPFYSPALTRASTACALRDPDEPW